jgi:hypothetical protein
MAKQNERPPSRGGNKPPEGGGSSNPGSPARTGTGAINTNRPAAQPRPGERYFWVRFHNKSEKNQPDDVELAVNGEVLTIKRNIPVPLPWRFIECAQNAVYPQYRQRPNEDRKVVAYIQHFPFDILGAANPEDFHRMKLAGTQAALAAVAEQEGGDANQNAQAAMQGYQPMMPQPPRIPQWNMPQPPAMPPQPPMPEGNFDPVQSEMGGVGEMGTLEGTLGNLEGMEDIDNLTSE